MFDPAMVTKSFNYILSDDKMRTYLKAQTRLLFEGLARDWQKVEQQVERLGFGEKYFVSQAKSAKRNHSKVTPAQSRMRIQRRRRTQ